MNPDYKELSDIINLSTCLNQQNIDAMVRALVAKGWTITRVENLVNA